MILLSVKLIRLPSDPLGPVAGSISHQRANEVLAVKYPDANDAARAGSRLRKLRLGRNPYGDDDLAASVYRDRRIICDSLVDDVFKPISSYNEDLVFRLMIELTDHDKGLVKLHDPEALRRLLTESVEAMRRDYG